MWVSLLTNFWGALDAVLRFPAAHDLESFFSLKQLFLLLTKTFSFGLGMVSFKSHLWSLGMRPWGSSLAPGPRESARTVTHTHTHEREAAWRKSGAAARPPAWPSLAARGPRPASCPASCRLSASPPARRQTPIAHGRLWRWLMISHGIFRSGSGLTGVSQNRSALCSLPPRFAEFRARLAPNLAQIRPKLARVGPL